MIKRINGPWPRSRQIQFISQFIQFQLRADTSGTEILILLLYLAVQLDLRSVTDWNKVICNVHSTIKEFLRRFITCAEKLFSNVAGADLFKSWCGRPIDI